MVSRFAKVLALIGLKMSSTKVSIFGFMRFYCTCTRKESTVKQTANLPLTQPSAKACFVREHEHATTEDSCLKKGHGGLCVLSILRIGCISTSVLIVVLMATSVLCRSG